MLKLDTIPLRTRIILEKVARDSGFDIPEAGEYLHFRCTDSPGEIILGFFDGKPSALFKVPPLLPPFKGIHLPRMTKFTLAGFENGELFQFEDFDHLENALRMYYLENRGKKAAMKDFDNELISEITETDKEMLVEVRTKQGVFRDRLMDYWGSRCAVTGISQPELLRASHIKPWAVSNSHERLDVYNGLLLNAFADAAFDRGLISFEDSGELIVSSKMKLVLKKHSSLFGKIALDNRHLVYLEYHRTNVLNNE